MIDFPDMLEKFLDSGEAPKLRVMFVDEAQDLSLIQWRLVKKDRRESHKTHTYQVMMTRLYTNGMVHT